jgi:DNA replication protein DnaC
MNELDIRRRLAALQPGDTITVSGEQVYVDYIGWSSQAAGPSRKVVNYFKPDGSSGVCARDAFSFADGQPSDRQRLNLANKEKEKLNDFLRTLSPRLRTYTFEAIEVHEGNHEAVARCKALEPGHNIFIHGDAGNGKTMLSVATVRHFAAHFSVAVWSVTEFCSAIRSSFGSHATKERPRLERTEILVLDDIDKVKSSDFVYEELYSLINYRHEHQLTTIFTANHGARRTAVKASPDPDNAGALLSRMASGDVVEIKGQDRRVLSGRRGELKAA